LNTEAFINSAKSLLRKKINLPIPGFITKQTESSPATLKACTGGNDTTNIQNSQRYNGPVETENFCKNDEEFIEALSSDQIETNYTFESEDYDSIDINHTPEITTPARESKSEISLETIPQQTRAKPLSPNSTWRDFSEKDSINQDTQNSTLDDAPSPALNTTDNTIVESKSEYTSTDNDLIQSETYFEEDTPEQEFNNFTSEEFDEQSDNYDWDEYENLEEYDENANQKPIHHHNGLEENSFSDRLSKSERAKQFALEVVTLNKWDEQAVPLLQDIFTQYGWAACKSAIQRQIEAGLTLEELSLAYDIKNHWANSEIFWIYLRYYAHASCKNMTWITALKLTRAFNGFPDIYEITVFIDETYDAWYSSPKLQKRFPGFYMFLENQCEKTTGVIQSNVHYTMKVTESNNLPEWIELGNGNYLRTSRPLYM